jgi:hypothetical protein
MFGQPLSNSMRNMVDRGWPVFLKNEGCILDQLSQRVIITIGRKRA